MHAKRLQKVYHSIHCQTVRQQANTFLGALSARISRDVDRDCRRLRSVVLLLVSVDRPLAQFIMFCLFFSFSSGNRAEIFIWRYRSGLVIIAMAFLPLSRPRFHRHCLAEYYCIRDGQHVPSRSSFPRFCHLHPRQQTAFFSSTRYAISVRRTPHGSVTMCTYNTSRDDGCNAPRIQERVLITRQNDSGPGGLISIIIEVKAT